MIHDQDILNNETRLSAELGVTSWLAAGFVLPVRVFKTSIRYLDASGNAVAIEDPFIHHNNRTIVGIADPLIAARAARRVGGFSLGARLGLTLPLGRTEEDPFELGDMGLAHEHSQFGTGTFQPVLGVDAARAFGRVRLDAFALTVQSLYANHHAYQAGDRYAAGLGVATAFGTTTRVRATFEVQRETAERWAGVVHTDEGNIGRTDVLAGAQVTLRVADRWNLAATLKLPVHVDVQGGQLESSAFVGLSIGTELRLFGGGDEHGHEHGHDHEHEHEHHEPVSWTGLDVADATTDGSAVDLVPVPGKLTVFDFWASWCEPCEDLDRELAELARANPGLAVRKVNVVDQDSPAWKRYLGSGQLPHVKVFGRDGALLFERTGTPADLAAEIERTLE